MNFLVIFVAIPILESLESSPCFVAFCESLHSQTCQQAPSDLRQSEVKLHAIVIAMALNHRLVFFAFVRNSHCHYFRMYTFFSRIESLPSALAFDDHEFPP
jgi:hypothetical protein